MTENVMTLTPFELLVICQMSGGVEQCGMECLAQVLKDTTTHRWELNPPPHGHEPEALATKPHASIPRISNRKKCHLEFSSEGRGFFIIAP